MWEKLCTKEVGDYLGGTSFNYKINNFDLGGAPEKTLIGQNFGFTTKSSNLTTGEFFLYSSVAEQYHGSPAGIYLLIVNNRNTKPRCQICSKLTIKTPKRRHWCRSGVFIVNFEHVSHLALVFLLLTFYC